jgi:siderophore synthetase component
MLMENKMEVDATNTYFLRRNLLKQLDNTAESNNVLTNAISKYVYDSFTIKFMLSKIASLENNEEYLSKIKNAIISLQSNYDNRVNSATRNHIQSTESELIYCTKVLVSTLNDITSTTPKSIEYANVLNQFKSSIIKVLNDISSITKN